MYEETKKTVKRALRLSNLLFGMNKEEYARLVKATRNITFPTTKEIGAASKALGDINKDDAALLLVRSRYQKAAKDSGLAEKYGEALFEYSILVKEIEE